MASDTRYLTKFELQRLLEKDAETRQRVSDIGGSGAVEVDNRSIEKTTGAIPKLKVKNGKSIEIFDGGIEVATPPFSGLGKRIEEPYTGIFVNCDGHTLFVDEDDSKLKVQIDADGGLDETSNGIFINTDDDTVQINDDSELEVKINTDGGLTVDTDGIKIDVGTDNEGKVLTVNPAGDGVEWKTPEGGEGLYVINLSATSGTIDPDDMEVIEDNPEKVVIVYKPDWSYKCNFSYKNANSYTFNSYHMTASNRFINTVRITITTAGAYTVTDNTLTLMPGYLSADAGKTLSVKSDGSDVEWTKTGISKMSMLHPDESRITSIWGSFYKLGNICLVHVGMQAKIDIVDNRRVAYIDSGMRPSGNFYIYPTFYSNRPSGTSQMQFKTDGDVYWTGSGTILKDSYFMLTGIYMTNE